ncbi:MAG TPA: M28 family peptidase [Vicinamibacterales bacterium]|nr:M28 family peptidase [Vicinamibacterales bacterium]
MRTIVLLAAFALVTLEGGQQPAPARLPATEPAAAVFALDNAFLQWPLPAGGQAYADIDGRHLHRYVVDQAAIARRYRDQGHPQFWGRITGTSADAASAQWLAAHFTRIGLTGVRVQPIDLPPQWMPQSWTVTATSSGTTLQLDRSAQPAYGSPGTTAEGLDVDAAWVGTGSEADFAGRDVRGKAVFMFSMPLPGSMNNTSTAEGGPKRAEMHGAAAVFEIIALPGNMRNMLYPARVNVPVFALGMEDGYAMRDLIGSASRPPRVRIHLDVREVPDEKSALVWGTLAGATDETIYVMAHRDGWFDAATDNASGVATMIGLAEHFAGLPRERRRRTMIFVGLDGHHNDAGVGRMWMVAHKNELFAKTALAINAEHTSTLQTYFYGERIRRSNTYTAQLWYAGGPTRPKLQDLAIAAFREFGVSIYAEPEQAPPPGDLGRFFRFVPGVDARDFNMYFHTDGETPETVPWTGLEASTRAYARIVDGVNGLELSDLQRPPEPEPTSGRP